MNGGFSSIEALREHMTQYGWSEDIAEGEPGKFYSVQHSSYPTSEGETTFYWQAEISEEKHKSIYNRQMSKARKTSIKKGISIRDAMCLHNFDDLLDGFDRQAKETERQAEMDRENMRRMMKEDSRLFVPIIWSVVSFCAGSALGFFVL